MRTTNISVVITTYNRPEKLLRCLRAIVNQIHPPHETIIVNDGSSLDYSECIDFINQHLSFKWETQQNQGVSAARNHGARKATGQFIAFCDDDDYFLPDHIKALTQEIAKQKGQPGIYHTFRKELNGNRITHPPIREKGPNETWQEHYITRGEMILCCTCMHKKVAEFSTFPEGIKYAEDHEQRLLALSQFPCFPIPKRTVVIDRTDETATNRSIHEIAEIYRDRFETMFANPAIAKHVRRHYRHNAKFRWTSLQLSAARKESLIAFLRHWTVAAARVRTIDNAKTLVIQMYWLLSKPDKR